ncbi:NAD-dependent epimerase/dehydratase family protein [Deinococcus planocerae]|uniref:NAD-dependent epimerase/dehydratase family protein n=1 Tax=Deinococcus planocerae TaxID=1737569 RepID=UPI000C7F35D0|nr:NAD(P)-dependent oxidoreductase [Deinococcus planocerae]
MRLLILGAHGFLGRHVHAHLARQPGLSVRAGPRSRALDLSSVASGTWLDLLDQARPDAVVNCAGRTSGDLAELTRANVTLVEHLIEAVAACGRPIHVVHLGSAAEYGPHPGAVDEDAPPRPGSPYGVTKLAGTHALLAARGAFPVTVLRVGNPIGRGQSEGSLPGRAALEFQRAVQLGLPDVTFGDLSARRDFIDARDLARAVETVVRRPPADPVLNVGRGEAVPARPLIEELAHLAGFRGRIHENAAGSSRSGAVPSQHGDTRRLRRLGWAPAYSLQDALAALWQGTVRANTHRLPVT